MTDINVSIIIPAHNAADTLADTIASLFAQTLPNWEAFIINDGSTDATEAIATDFAAQDKRIHLISQPQHGVCAARNVGIQAAQFDWLLFLDADDWIAPHYLERMTQTLAANPQLDWVHCGWVRVAPDGTVLQEKYAPSSAEAFSSLARYCPFAIHDCIVRKSLVESVGGFDLSLKTCEDWDLWQRIARTGARYDIVPEVMAFYRMRLHSLSGDGVQLLADGLRVIHQGHAPDPRVLNPHPDYKEGICADELPGLRLYFASWSAGLVLGMDQDAAHLLNAVQQDHAPGLDPRWIAQRIFESASLPTCQTPGTWWQLWQRIAPKITDFLNALELQSQAPKLARRAQIYLERLILQHANPPLPLAIGTSYAVAIEVTEPIGDITAPEGVERLYGVIQLNGELLGRLELPFCDGQVLGAVLADAIAAEFFWKILEQFFKQTLYTTPSYVNTELSTSELHNQVGWTAFLRELWQRPDWSSEQFYDAALSENSAPKVHSEDGLLTVEVSNTLPDVTVLTSNLNVVMTVGGIGLGAVSIPVEHDKVTAQALRVALTAAGGIELCRVCVREGLLNRPFSDSLSLRERLAEAAKKPNSEFTDWAKQDSEQAVATLTLGQRSAKWGTSISRRAALPIAASKELVEAATITGESVIPPSSNAAEIQRIIYAPEVIHHTHSPSEASVSTKASAGHASPYDRSYFETLFATQPDPWKYTHPYEQVKYEQTLSLLPKKRIKRALELACAEGHFTVQLAPRVGHLIASDLSQIALERTAQRCNGLKQIDFQQLDLVKDALPGQFDLIVCSEVLYYVGGLEALQTFALKIRDALNPGGYFLTAHANLVVDAPDEPGYNWDHPFGVKRIGEIFAQTPGLSLLKELKTPLYRVLLFQRDRRSWLPFRRPTPERIELPQPTSPPPQVAHMVLWHGGFPQRWDMPQIVTDRLPILMYHQVTSSGTAALSRWRVTPEQFEEQLRYLRDSGYYSITLETWQQAILTKTPPPGRAVLLTFDDGYLDFLTNAYPLLKQYGFSATVFLVADRVGQTNGWDAVYGEEVPLLDWQQIRYLQAQGIEFGSHSASHRSLTALSIPEIVQEGARSRAVLSQELQVPVRSLAYPYGDFDQVVAHLMGACGYTIGVTCRSGRSSLQDSSLTLPRIEIEGSDTLQNFVAKLSV